MEAARRSCTHESELTAVSVQRQRTCALRQVEVHVGEVELGLAAEERPEGVMYR